MNETKDNDLIKVKIPLAAGEWHGGDAEWIWANPLGRDTYRIDNIPAFAPGLALGDVIAAPREDGVPVFRTVLRRGGHSTYWLFFSSHVGSPEMADFLHKLRSLGCHYEGVKGRIVTVDVRPEADIDRVYAFLETAEHEGLLQFEEGHCGHRLRNP